MNQLKKVYILSRLEFNDLLRINKITDENVEEKQAFFISINETETLNTNPKNHFNQEHTNVKIIHFDDIVDVSDISEYEKEFNAKAFTKEQARELIEFIIKNADKPICIVHCAAGISRSGAVGRFINDFFGGDDEFFRKTNPHIHPNSLVTRLLKEVFRNEFSKK